MVRIGRKNAKGQGQENRNDQPHGNKGKKRKKNKRKTIKHPILPPHRDNYSTTNKSELRPLICGRAWAGI
jgi:hypothetical protein